ncbi:hypothetical protein BDZ88DRAFT_439987 [Geranomyces variabilis]|nr:hypothetical protein BDZ88DRAFT_439987 [Geranomyces variabilis]KAJ3140995.1 hypothetical protein HDU90_007018 [Geranomyces variabilis]
MQGKVEPPVFPAGFYEEVEGEHLRRHPGLVIHRNQFNVARHAVQTACLHGVDLALDGPWVNLNFLLVGPTYRDLRDQTRKDLSDLLNHRHDRIEHLFTAAHNIQSILEHNVLNSNRLSAVPFDEQLWVRQLNAHPYDWLHLLVCDEVHWGAGAEQGADKWLQKLLACLKRLSEADSEKRRPNLIILLVSATPDPITAVVYPLSEDGDRMVDWQEIADPPHTYQNIMDLPLRNDESTLQSVKKSALRSGMVAADYLWVLDQWLQYLGYPHALDMGGDTAQAFSGKPWHTSATFEALAQVLPFAELSLNGDLDLARSACWEPNYDPVASNANMLVVRLSSNNDVLSLVAGIKTRFAAISLGTGSTFSPFEVLAYVQGSDIAGQLTPKARTQLGVARNASLAIHQLEGLPCIVVVNNLLSMGTRLPRTVKGWDVRARYIGDAVQIQNASSTWKQDVGRVAGHDKTVATIFMSLTDETNAAGKSTTGRLRPRDLRFKNRHPLLTNDGKATTGNIEHPTNSQIISRLVGYTVALKADMQIGKTGAILAFIDILYHENIVEAPEVSRTTPILPVSAASDLAKWTEQLGRVVNSCEHADVSSRVDALASCWQSNPCFFARYHEALASIHSAQILSRTIAALISAKLGDLVSDQDDQGHLCPPPFTIMDAGCGMHGVFKSLAQHYAISENSYGMASTPGIFRIIGSDLHPLIKTQTTGPEDQGPVHFQAYVGDMCVAREACGWLDDAHITRGGCNFIVYSLSLFETAVTRHLQWAYRNLAPHGMLFIADIPRRFPATFNQSVMEQGFVRPSKHVLEAFEIRSFRKSTAIRSRQGSVELLPYTVVAI